MSFLPMREETIAGSRRRRRVRLQAVDGLEGLARMLQQLAVGRMVHRFDSRQMRAKPADVAVERLVRLEMVEQRLFGLARAGQDPFPRSAQRVDDAIIEVEIGGRPAGSNHPPLVLPL